MMKELIELNERLDDRFELIKCNRKKSSDEGDQRMNTFYIGQAVLIQDIMKEITQIIEGQNCKYCGNPVPAPSAHAECLKNEVERLLGKNELVIEEEKKPLK